MKRNYIDEHCKSAGYVQAISLNVFDTYKLKMFYVKHWKGGGI